MRLSDVTFRQIERGAGSPAVAFAVPRAAAVVLLLATCAWAAPPEVSSLLPTGVQRGQTAEVSVAGNFATWPPTVWVEPPGVTIEPAAEKGKLKITAAPDAGGIYWVRLANGEGASVPRPLLVSPLADVVESEPNNALSEAQTLGGLHAVSGKLARRGDVDVYAVPLRAGQTLVAELLASEVLGSPMDGVLQVCHAAGHVLAQEHDTRGLDPRLVFTARESGTYFVRLFAFPAQPDSAIQFAGGDNYLYRLSLTTGPFVDHTQPLAVQRGAASELLLAGYNLSASAARLGLAPHDWRERWLWQPPGAVGLVPLRVVEHAVAVVGPGTSRQSPQPVALPATLTGQLAKPRQADVVSFSAAKGSRLEVRVESQSLGYDLDPVVTLADASGKTLAENDDGSRNERDSLIVFSPPADGTYQLAIADLHGRGGMRMVYRCTIAPVRPDFSLSIAAGSFRVAAGATVEIPVTVERREGFSDEIEIQAVELPGGITAQPVRSPAQGEASKLVKLVLQAGADPPAGPFRVVGTSLGNTPIHRTATFEAVLGSAKSRHRDVWIAVGK
jgi:hypothetical protein